MEWTSRFLLISAYFILGVRKKKKRDLLRLQVARIFAANAEQGCFRHSLAQPDNSSILQCLGEYIEGMRTILESENDKEDASLMQLRLYFSKFLHKMIKSIPVTMQSSLLRNQVRKTSCSLVIPPPTR